ncbi:MAG: hypothetical protein PHI28_02120 [Mangrovibacterium sp.]|nr:hypothetical protein [Mangrovibacterium sp.]
MHRTTVLLNLVLFCSTAPAQNGKKGQLIKNGWNFGALPAVTYDTDLGFQYGALANLYHYGAGLRIVMNENFVVAFDYGMASDSRDGATGFYMGLNYLF